MLKQRLISGLILGLLALAIFWFGDPWFTLVVAVFSIIGTFEYQKLVNPTVWPKLIIPATIASLLFTIRYFLVSITTDSALITIVILISLLWLLLLPKHQRSFVHIAWTLTGILYVGWLLGYWIILRNTENGRYWALLALFANVATDIFAFFTGRSLGKIHLAPSISPSKTWEGTIGGFCGAIAVTILLSLVFPLGLSMVDAFVFGLLVAVSAQLGDLIESILKRSINMKDSSNLIPGHGGLLDRLDSLLFGGPVAYYVIIFLTK